MGPENETIWAGGSDFSLPAAFPTALGGASATPESRDPSLEPAACPSSLSRSLDAGAAPGRRVKNKKAPPAAPEKVPAPFSFEGWVRMDLWLRLETDRRRLLTLLRELRMGLLGAHSRERMLGMIEDELLRQ